MIYLYYIICFALYIFCSYTFLNEMGVSEGHLIGAFTYQFAHTSLLHLVLNTFCLSVMFNPIHNLYTLRFGWCERGWLFVTCYALSVLAAFPTAMDVPTIGGSGIVFTLLGMLLALNPTKRQLKAFIWVAAAVAVQWWFGKSNTMLHLTAMLFGSLWIIARILYVNIRNHRN